MENPSFDILLSDKYLDGTISEAELAQLKSQFESPEAFEREMEIQRRTLEAIQYEGSHELVSKMLPSIEQKLEAKGFFTKEENEKTHTAKIKQLVPWTKKIAVAAAFLLIAVGVWFIVVENSPINRIAGQTIAEEQKSSQVVVNDIQEKIDKEIQGWDGITTEQWKILRDGIQAFQKENYPLSIEHFEHFHTIYAKNETAAFYLALCYYERDNYQKAHHLLSSITYKEYKTKALWFKALSLWKMDEKEEAFLILERLTESDLYGEQAKQLLLKQKN